jgi:hypothetical protein
LLAVSGSYEVEAASAIVSAVLTWVVAAIAEREGNNQSGLGAHAVTATFMQNTKPPDIFEDA